MMRLVAVEELPETEVASVLVPERGTTDAPCLGAREGG